MCGTLRGSPPFCNWGEADLIETSVNKDWTCKDKDKDKDFTYSYLLQVAAKPTIAIKQRILSIFRILCYQATTMNTK